MITQMIKQRLIAVISAGYAMIVGGTAEGLLIGTHSAGTFSYEVNNTSGKSVIGWSLTYGPVADWNQDDTGFSPAGDVLVPADWFASGSNAAHTQDFFSLGGDIPDGGSLAGFAFPSSYAVGTATYTEFYDDLTSFSALTIGPVAGTNPVPDSGSTLLLGALAASGMMCFGRGLAARKTINAMS
jgi:hypothetical protein